MEFDREVLLQQKQKQKQKQQQRQQLDDFKVQSSLCPSTPAKSAPTQSSISSNGQMYHKSLEPNWPEALQGPSKTRRVGEDAVSKDCSSSSSSSHSSRPTFLTYNPEEGGWRQTPGTNPSDWNPFFTLLLQSQIGDGFETQLHPNQLLFNNVPPNLNLSNGISPSTPKSMGNTISVGRTDGLPTSCTPETVEKNKHLQEYLHRKVTSLVQEKDSGEETLVFDSENWPSQIASQANLYISNNIIPAAYKTVASTSTDTLIPSSEFVEPLQVLFTDQQQNEVRSGISASQDGQLLNAQKHELEKASIDLNRTPQNKPKRRKHRPKVIQEGKPVRTPKPTTPKVAMNNKGSSTGKRNNVREKMGQSSSDALSSMFKDSVDPKNSNSRKSVRRCLNFDSDPPEARAVCPEPTATSMHGTTLQTLSSCLQDTINSSSTMSAPEPTATSMHGSTLQTLSSCLQDTINSSSTMSAIQLSRQSDGVMENPVSEMPLDLNGSVHQVPYVYVRSSREQNSIIQQSRGEKYITNQNLDHFVPMPENFSAPSDTGIRSNYVNDTTTIDRNPDTNEVQSDSGGVSFAMPKQKKRNQNVIQDPYISNYREFMRAFGGISQLNKCLDMNYHDLHFPTGFKKNRTENQDDELVLNASFEGVNMPTNSWRAKCVELNNRLMAHEELQASKQILDFGKIDRQRADVTVWSHESNSVNSNRTTPLNNHQMLSPMKLFRGSERNERQRFENQTCNAAHPVTNSKAKPQRETKNRQAQLANPQLSNTCPIVNKNHDTSALVSVDLREKISPHKTSPKSDSSSKNFHGNNLMSAAIKPCGDSLDDITKYIRHIIITETHEDARAVTENALVPYVVNNAIVPYDMARKRQTRPKVDLDEETFRVWNLLMGKGENDCVEGKDGGKEKWWEEERKVFHGRVDSFIARMHLVQGDRRFSKWKGSVVDSVVGVFLTQNVSDHLSSSAFMAVAARFPLMSVRNNESIQEEKKDISVEMQERCSASLHYSGKLQEHMLRKNLHCIGLRAIHGENESSNSNESLASDTRGRIGDCSRKFIDTYETSVGCETPHNNSVGVSFEPTGKTSQAEPERRWSFDDAASSKNCIVSSQNSENQVPSAARTELNSQSNLQNEDLITGKISDGIGFSPSFVELLLMAERILPENFLSGVCQQGNPILEKKSSILDPSGSLGSSSSPSGICFFNNFSRAGLEDVTSANIISDESRLKQLPEASAIKNTDENKQSESSVKPSAITANKITGQEKLSLVHGNKLEEDSSASTNKHFLKPASITETEACVGNKIYHYNDFQKEEGETSTSKSFSKRYSHLVNEGAVEIPQSVNDKFAENMNSIQTQMRNHVSQQNLINFSNKERNPLEAFHGVESNLKNEVHSSHRVSAEAITKLEEKTVKVKKDKKGTFAWDSLRGGAHQNGTKERNNDTMDSIDWEAVRCAGVEEISNTIRERGMNNKLAERIKDFLNRLVEDHGSIDLEWLRDVEPDKVKDYLLSIQGLGLKSVECVRLLTLQHLAFPVDTNVGRICVRLGWVPLQPLPESLQLHLLEMYPLLETIQKYLWPRLCKLDQRTLYELHYQMITFGKVFCTKSKPNCNACPMKGECKHFASAFASARLALPGPEEKGLATKTPLAAFKINHAPELQQVKPLQLHHAPALPPVKPLQIEVSRDSKENRCCNNCEPIIEEPSTPEAEQLDAEESAIEDMFHEDPDEIPTIKLNVEEFTQNLHNYMQEHNLEIIDADVSKALVAINPEAAFIPTPKLKNISRLRTEHHVYELPDSHPLLEGWEQRERDDPSSYLLAIWTPGETAQSCEPPEAFCNSQETGKLCCSTSCFFCNSIREAEAQTVRGTILIPCRTAMRGSFPLNGTYFQVNEVFADHDTSRNPINVPRKWIWNLPRRTVYFGTSIPTIFKGLTTPEIQQCFWRGFVCVRGFDRTTRAPKPLYARLHFPASKAPKNKKAPAAKQQN